MGLRTIQCNVEGMFVGNYELTSVKFEFRETLFSTCLDQPRVSLSLVILSYFKFLFYFSYALVNQQGCYRIV